VIFKKVFKAKYYDHFIKLVVGIHFSESRAIIGAMEKCKSFLHEFLLDHPKLYMISHNQQVLHSLHHVGQTISDYRPLISKSTFQFENILDNIFLQIFSIYCYSYLGMIMRTIKSTRRE
jgi:hypothetical protein